MKLKFSTLGISLAAPLTLILASAIQLAAQTTPAATTCTTPPTTLTALNFERATTLANILTTLTPNIPANVAASIAGGAQEIREIFVYNPQRGTVTSTVFLVAAGAPLPTPSFNFQTGVIQTATVQISQILTGCNPVPSLLLVGRVIDSSATGAFGNLNGSPAAVSVGYTTDNPPKINNVAEVIAGVVTAWSKDASGTLMFPPVSSTPPGTAGVTVLVMSPQLGNIAAGTTPIQVSQNPVLLDASGSKGSGPLVFTWSSLGAPLNFVGTGTPGQILVTFPGKGDFTILLTVTDTSTGASTLFSFILESTA